MGRTILAADNIQTYVEKLQNSGTWYLGLIIGKFCTPKDYALHLVRTPEPMEDQASDDDSEQITGGPEGRVKKRHKSQSKPASLEEMNEQWASTHAKQVTMMLPGGIRVMGVFALAPETMITKSQAKLRQILYAIQKQEKKLNIPEIEGFTTDRVLLQICSTTKRYTCRTIDVSDPKSTFRPAEWKFQVFTESWNRLETNIGISVPVTIPEKSANTSLTKQIQTGLQPFCQLLWTSLVEIDGSLRDKTELLNLSTERKARSKDRLAKSQHTYQCNILVKQSNSCLDTVPLVHTCSTRLDLKGTIHGRAYVSSKSTVVQAQQALLVDIIRSVLSRCELLCDDIQILEEDAEKQEVYTTPRRVFFKLPGTDVDLCDYMFADEKPNEVKGRVQELLDICVEEDDLDISTERAPTSIEDIWFAEEDCARLYEEESTEPVEAETTDRGQKGIRYYLIAGIGGVLATVAAALTYMLTENS